MNDHTFVKLYEKDGRQLLIVKDSSDDDGTPEIRFTTTTMSGARATKIFGYAEDKWDDRDEAFEMLNEENAWEYAPSGKLLDL